MAHLLAPGYRKVHELAVERLQKLGNGELDESVTYFDGSPRRSWPRWGPARRRTVSESHP